MIATDALISRRRAAVIVSYAVSALWGAAFFAGPDPLMELLVSLAGGTAVTQFCMFDSRIQGRPLAWSVPWLIFCSWPISVPAYLFWSRGLRRMCKPALHILAFLAAPYVGYACAALIAWGLGVEG